MSRRTGLNLASCIKALQPLRDADTSALQRTAVTPGPITVIGTGNTPLNQVQGVNNRDYFFRRTTRHARQPRLHQHHQRGLSNRQRFVLVAVWSGPLRPIERHTSSLLKSQIDLAHSKVSRSGIGSTRMACRYAQCCLADLVGCRVGPPHVDDLDGCKTFGKPGGERGCMWEEASDIIMHFGCGW